MQSDIKKGLVVRVTGQEVWVEIGGRTISCVLRGRFRIQEKGFQIVAGDLVEVKLPEREGAAGTIEKLERRRTYLARYIERDAAERVVVANVERLFVVATLHSPRVHYGFVDRVLVAAEKGNVNSCVVLNKVDLGEEAGIESFTRLYESCGYRVARTSAITGEGISRLSERIREGVYAFVGESGVGKTSLLMKIEPDLDLKVRTLSGKSGRGRHTTAFSQLFEFKGGFLADTPGIQTFGFPGSDKMEVASCFPEFRAFLDGCRFSPCTHSHEPECGVKQALEEGAIEPTRYQSYLNILSEVEEREKRASW